MNREPSPRDDLLRRAAYELYFRPTGGRSEPQEPRAQQVPVNVYETEGDVVVIAPMPGVEAENLEIEVHGNALSLRASMRGPGQEDRRYVVHEWTYGPYERVVELPVEVDAERANASLGNGVLAISLPKAQRERSVRIPLRQVGSSEARHEGHSGHHTARQGPEGSS